MLIRDRLRLIRFFFFKQKTAYEMLRSLVGSEMCIRDRYEAELNSQHEAYEKKLKELREIVRKAKDKDDNLVEQDVLQRLKERVVNLESEINDLKNEKKYISDLKQRSDEEKNKLLNELKDLEMKYTKLKDKKK
eukprot:TRINITY_DN5953_c0_g1_i3.p1 TRINITY_DN5953_c0_g1~~TRINITY_DN5953_c0_g1_i3.p1  ORF type:complete len:134 (+),score=45.91 TRINITY_DN5953_c0_g1_i3:1-402(+)